MKPILNRLQMTTLDRRAIDEIGIPTAVLMERAGYAVARAMRALLRRQEPSMRTALSVCGLGNNGADAVVAARYLHGWRVPVEILVVGARGDAKPELEAQVAIAERLGIGVVFLDNTEAAGPRLEAALVRRNAIVDGLFGTGLSRPLAGLVRDVVVRLAALGRPTVSVDIPSGVDADTGQELGASIRADTTVSFQFPKLGHVLFPGRARAGRLVVADIGLPPSLLAPVLGESSGRVAHRLDHEAVSDAFPTRSADVHKGTFGHLLIAAGTAYRPGAALLVGRAALRSGVGLATLASDLATIQSVAPALDELMGLPISGDGYEAKAAMLSDALRVRSALAIGPSLEPTPETAEVVRRVLETCAEVPAVVDAGALAALSAVSAGGPRGLRWLRDRAGDTLMTPHPGEMARLMGISVAEVQKDRVEIARRLAGETGSQVVLKGASTVVASPSGLVFVSLAGNPGMATGGSGDVLTGVLGALLARGVSGALAARAGVWLHACAGDLAAQAFGPGLIASDIIGYLPKALQLVAKEERGRGQDGGVGLSNGIGA
ncbi:MAG: NAD(P)H-hydrate dehydratase [Deltaproteobacteria bacterium]|nr:NAD(P)H-hydrate dehydratase [Deltaproteobacteria bacterium]